MQKIAKNVKKNKKVQNKKYNWQKKEGQPTWW